jgi:hypothetical protein
VFIREALAPLLSEREPITTPPFIGIDEGFRVWRTQIVTSEHEALSVTGVRTQTGKLFKSGPPSAGGAACS